MEIVGRRCVCGGQRVGDLLRPAVEARTGAARVPLNVSRRMRVLRRLTRVLRECATWVGQYEGAEARARRRLMIALQDECQKP
jgi:hypothetical protein